MIAITRDVSASIQRAELTHLERQPIDFARARAEQRDYRTLLRELGCTVLELATDDAHPDCVFIEDTAVVLPHVAIITRPGAESRRGEVGPVEAELRRFRPTVQMTAPATLDGGDVLVAGDTIYVGLSQRTNAAGVQQLRTFSGMNVVAVPVEGALHLKTAVTRVSDDALLIDPTCVARDAFPGWRLIETDPAERFAANALRIGTPVIYPEAFPLTRARMLREGIDVRTVDASEITKAEGGVTCCSLVFDVAEG
jgi:dimethylargininase